LVRGAREGVLFLMGNATSQTGLLNEILQLGGEDLFIQGISTSGPSSDVTLHDPAGTQLISVRFSGADQSVLIGSTVVLIDPFGPHPVVIAGSHDLRSRTSAQTDANLVIFENASGLAGEYAVHIIRLYDRYRFRRIISTARARAVWVGLKSDDTWQDAYFRRSKRTEFNFLFGTLSPGL
jgi:hypothetical protein